MKIARITQTPKIDFTQVEEMGKQIQAELAKYKTNDLVVTEDNVKSIKQLRTRFRKDFKEVEDIRKQIKSAINNPYDEFEKAYKEHIAEPYKQADKDLKLLVDDVEDKLKQIKEDEIREHFNQLSKDIEFIKYEDARINVTLSASIKSLKEEAEAFINNVVEALALIETQDNKERVLVEYKRSLNAVEAITRVNEAIKQEEELKAKQEEVIEPPKEVEPIIEPVVETVIEPIAEKLIVAQMTVTATRSQILELKAFMEERGISYE